MRNYTVCSNLTLPNSSTLPIVNILSNGNVRPMCYELLFGSSDTPVNYAARFTVRRCSTAGTPGSNPTPAPLDPGDPASATTSGLATFSSGPTLGTTLLQFGMNQQATVKWQPAPGRELKTPATNNNGLALMNPSASTAFTLDFTFAFEE